MVVIIDLALEFAHRCRLVGVVVMLMMIDTSPLWVSLSISISPMSLRGYRLLLMDLYMVTVVVVVLNTDSIFSLLPSYRYYRYWVSASGWW